MADLPTSSNGAKAARWPGLRMGHRGVWIAIGRLACRTVGPVPYNYPVTDSTPPLDYAAINLMLRAPRVAVIVDGAEQAWLSAARIALAQCSQVWGGSGFVLVPHRDGVVDPVVLRAVVAYDPDYVAVSVRTIAEQEAAAPGALLLEQGNTPLDGEERSALVGRISDVEAYDEMGHLARTAVIGACSTHRMRDENEEGKPEWDDDLHQLGKAGPSGPGLTAVAKLGTYLEKPCMSAAPTWGGALGLLTAAKLGSAQHPATALNTSPVGDEAIWTAAWLQGFVSIPPDAATELVLNPAGPAMSFKVQDLPAAWHNAQGGLTTVSLGSTRLTPAWVVVGDAPDDFALWMILDRLYGHAVWLHSDWFSTDSEESRDVLKGVTHDWQRFKRGLHVCSVRAAEVQVNAVANFLQDLLQNPGEGRRTPRGRQLTSGQVPWGDTGSLTLAARKNFSAELPVPVHRDAEGGVQLVTKPPAIAIGESLEGDGLTWQVDLSFDDSAMPRRRGLQGSELCAQGQDPLHTHVRNSRAGITWHSARYDFIQAGMAPDQQVARPRVRELSLSDWAAAMSRQRGYANQYSASGISAQVLATLWGGRSQMVDDFAGPWREVLRFFGPSGAPNNQGSSTKYDEGVGVVITGHGGILTFKGIAGCWPGDTDRLEVRAHVDRLVARRVLRRGLALICSECHKAAFVAVDDLSQTNRCTSCSAVNQLDGAAWKKPYDEPLRFYDLHPVAREFMQGNGDAPLVAAQHLKAASKSFADAAET